MKRLVASAVVCARFLGARRADADEAARAAVRSYRKRMHEYAGMGFLALYYARIDDRAVLDTLTSDARLRAEQVIRKAKHRTNLQVMEKLANLVDAKDRIVEQPPLIVRETRTAATGKPMAEALNAFMADYKKSLLWDRRALLDHYRIVDVARKAVGVGSVGTRCWVIYLRGLG